ncbi:Immunoglobulin E-set [Penicillium bovifimosum]|uniref:Immunoglobulin E-set n=1 Tax=Penicillium bovifimosum TaxID=126998 RepID=A0A9W9L6W3_9EURO|nr:Immunoglobulin E-set [Penicillium bovifimosum]KAJ5139287.1 Immunoglobulin E-set [Penicillium bovifimosum]
MGNNPSKGPVSDAPPAHAHHSSAGDRKVARRSSHNAISAPKAVAADPSATKETAAGQSAAYERSVHQRLQSRNVPESTPKNIEKPQQHDAEKTGPSPIRDIPSRDPSNPVQVPVARHVPGRDSVAPSAPPLNSYYSASAHLQRPPRLPLPIGDANTTPGSPIAGPEDSHIQSLPADRLLDEQMDATTAASGHTTIEDEELLDELQPYTISGAGKAVPVLIEWTAPAQKVYVTGTFVNWEKKFRLHKSENGSVMSTTLNLRPGTHHLKFIVDGEMRASDSLPTAVDFTNHLVNYIEISADDAHDKDFATQSGVQTPQTLPDSSKHNHSGVTDDHPPEKEETEEEVPPGDFGNAIPQFLADLDKEEDSPAYVQAANVIGDTATPPSLPLFLGKSILNGTTPMKDDSSVLNYPNHTVLNHLATSSIKNGVLATSVTTRYKRKYVTTILYKPTGDITG